MKIHKEEQYYHDWYVIGIMMLISFIIAQGLVQKYLTESGAILTLGLSLTIIALLFAAGWFIVRRLPMSIKIGQKNLSVSVPFLFWLQVKLKKEDVNEIEFVKLSNKSISSGWHVHYREGTRIFDMGDHCGMVVTMKDGKQYVVCSRNLYDNRKELQKQFREFGWKV